MAPCHIYRRVAVAARASDVTPFRGLLPALGSLSTSEVLVGDFSLLRYTIALVVAAVVANVGMFIADFVARLLFTSFDVSKCSLPSQLPWPDPAGQSLPFDVPVPEASAEQLARFLAFRGIKCLAFMSDEEQRETAAREAVTYMQELWDAKHDDWCHRRYALKEKGLAFPYRAPFMNDWNFYGETSAHLRPVGTGQIIFALEHFLIGVGLPLIYLFSRNDSVFYFLMYADMAWESYDMLAMFWRRATGSDYTVSRYDKAIDSVMVPHHIFTVGLEMMALMAAAGISKPFMTQVLIANHLTGGLMLAAVVLHQTPAQSWPQLLHGFQAVVLGSLYLCRVVWWTPMSAACLRLAYIYTGDFPDYITRLGLHGLGYQYPLASPIFLAVLGLMAFLMHFNLDLLSVNTKLLRKAAARAARHRA